MKPEPCECGSGLYDWPLYDARGIYVRRVCDKCVEKVKSHFRPEIFVDPQYECDEPIEEDEY
jgi:hypothetical protein